MKEQIVNKTKILQEEENYPTGANSPTYITTYECFCKKGVIKEENTIGFNDCFITLKCNHCLKKYHSFIDIYGRSWKIYLKD